MLFFENTVSWEKEIGFIGKPHIIQKIWILINFAAEPLTHGDTLSHVIWGKPMLNLYLVGVQV